MSAVDELPGARNGGPDPEADELYVGYLPTAPPRTARWMRRVVPSLVVGALALAATLAWLQRPFDPGVFEFGEPRRVEGTLFERPYPRLVGHGAGTGPGGGSERAALLVDQGKHGAAAEADGLDGRRVRLEATRIESPLGSMLEIVAGSLTPLDGVVATGSGGHELGRVQVLGEIVDSKCFLGVMKPGRGKPHRACAARCLSGGIPPALLVRSEDESRLLLLAAADGGSLAPSSFLDLVGEPVTARGTVESRDGLLMLLLDSERGLERGVAAR